MLEIIAELPPKLSRRSPIPLPMKIIFNVFLVLCHAAWLF